MQFSLRFAVCALSIGFVADVAGILCSGHPANPPGAQRLGRFYPVLDATVYAAELRQVKAKTNPPSALIALPDGKGKDTVKRICSGCHSTNTVASQHYSREKWSSVLDAMTAKGMEATDDETAEMLDYLSLNFAPPSDAEKH